jgi:hypothetical protein
MLPSNYYFTAKPMDLGASELLYFLGRTVVNKYMKIAFVILTLLISSCALFPSEHEIPATNEINIHDSPKVGDYAILEDSKKEFKNTWRIDKVMGDRIDVSFIWEFRSTSFSKKNHYLMTVNREGKVLSARFRYADDNIKNMPVANPGEAHSRLDYDKSPVPVPIIAATPVGNFDINTIASYGLLSGIGGIVKSDNGFILELSNDVPFNVVKMYVTNTLKKGVLVTTLEFFEEVLKITAAQNPIDAYSRAIKSILSEKGDNTLELEYTLTAFGRGE